MNFQKQEVCIRQKKIAAKYYVVGKDRRKNETILGNYFIVSQIT